jgi:hypothetical protein
MPWLARSSGQVRLLNGTELGQCRLATVLNRGEIGMAVLHVAVMMLRVVIQRRKIIYWHSFRSGNFGLFTKSHVLSAMFVLKIIENYLHSLGC